MIPFLPALLLLLLSGSSGLEKLSQDHRVPARLRALAYELCLREAQASVAEPLLVGTGKPVEFTVYEATVDCPAPDCRLSAGFFSAQRSRDGPSAA